MCIYYLHAQIYIGKVNNIECCSGLHTPLHHEVHPSDPGTMSFHEYVEGGFVEVRPTHIHQKDRNVSNLCWLDGLFLANRERLYRDVCKLVLHSAVSFNAGAVVPKVPFEIVRMAPDGRCGWRAILAAQDLAEPFSSSFLDIWILKVLHFKRSTSGLFRLNISESPPFNTS